LSEIIGAENGFWDTGNVALFINAGAYRPSVVWSAMMKMKMKMKMAEQNMSRGIVEIVGQ
jgi:hypothetical protein